MMGLLNAIRQAKSANLVGDALGKQLKVSMDELGFPPAKTAKRSRLLFLNQDEAKELRELRD